MDSNDSKQTLEEVLPPLSPISECFSSSILPLTILAVFELENPIHKTQILEILRNEILPYNARLSSVIDTSKKDLPRWKKVDIRIEDHVIIPKFPANLSPTDYDEHLTDYMSKIASERFLENKPLWEIHLINYPTSNGNCSVVYKLSHAIGDGYSFIALVVNTFRRADNPSLPLTFPSLSLRKDEGRSNYLWNFTSKFMNTATDLVWILWKGWFSKDNRTAIRSGKDGVEFEPISISSISLSLEHVKRVKSQVGGTLNDVIIGLIYYVINLYMSKMGHISSSVRMTSVVMINMRMLKGYKTIDEMLKANIWGNHSGCSYAPIPIFTNVENVDPLNFIIKARANMKRMKNSMFIYLTYPIIKTLRCFKGPKGVAQFIHSRLKNSTTIITNVVGPKEQMAMADSPVNNSFFIVTGIPQSLSFTIVTNMGQLRLVATMEKRFIDSQTFTSCMKEAVQNIFEAASGKDM